jgi:6-phosphogluconolactonase
MIRVVLASVVALAVAVPSPAGPVPVYIGTYTKGKGQGIVRLDMDAETGALTSRGVVAEAVNPSFLTLSPDSKFLYSVSEVSGQPGVAAFAVDAATGGLKELNRQPTGGGGPCHVAVDPTGRYLLVANYGGGSVSVVPIRPDGSLGERTDLKQHRGGSGVVKSRQEGPHAHSVTLDPTGRRVVVADLGLDQLLVYSLDPATGKLTLADTVASSPGAGPRHFAFHPNGRLAFAINELDSTLTAYRYDPETGKLSAVATARTLPEGFTGGNTTAEVRVHPGGKFVYASNRGHDSIAAFAVDGETGRLTPLGHTPTEGKTPRNFNIDPTGRFLLAANQNSGNVVAFRIDPATGQLTPTGSRVEVPFPVCVLFGKTGQ